MSLPEILRRRDGLPDCGDPVVIVASPSPFARHDRGRVFGFYDEGDTRRVAMVELESGGIQAGVVFGERRDGDRRFGFLDLTPSTGGAR